MNRRFFFALLFTLMSGNLAWAELPPGAYEQMLKEAPEVYQVVVDKVVPQSASESGVENYLCDAKITAVERSQLGRKSGDTIQFSSYYVPPQLAQRGFVGPQSPPLLKSGWEGKIYFSAPSEGTTLKPAAYGRSFVPSSSNSFSEETKRGATLGIRMRPLLSGGLEVLAVSRDSLADDLGLRPRDRVLKVNGKDIAIATEVKTALAADAQRVTITLQRRERMLELSLAR